MSGFERVAVAGAGAFGTALALVAHRAGCPTTLWARDPRQAEQIGSTGENLAYLPAIAIPPGILVTADPAALRAADLILLAAPAQATRLLLAALASSGADGPVVVACAKGIESATGRLQAEVIAECCPQARAAALSGPGFAEEIARGLPTALTIAAGELALARTIAAALSSDALRLYASDDMVGVELGGALKNVLAIACGVVAGRGLGESARAALIARGLAEMMRLGAAFGARPETFMGLSGLGDLVLTATSPKSRNTAFGMELGRGGSVAELLRAGAPLAEGAHSAAIADELARRAGADAPITAAVAALVAGRIGVDEAIGGLVSRPLKAENA